MTFEEWMAKPEQEKWSDYELPTAAWLAAKEDAAKLLLERAGFFFPGTQIRGELENQAKAIRDSG